MPTLKKLEVKNFESHVDSTLEFHPKINVITGETDVGKSSLKRSLEWAACNRPSGDRMRRHGTKKTQVLVDAVTKIRTATKHRYEVGKGVYKALRAQVPEPVMEALNLSAINFQGQHKPYFLINDSPGKVAKAFNEVADLTLIDDVLGECKKRIRENKIHGVYLRKLRKDKQIEKQEVEWSIDADKELSAVENLHIKATTLQLDIDQLEETVELCIQRKAEVEEIPSPHKDQAEIDQSIIDIDKQEVTQLFEIVNIVNNCEVEILKIPSSKKESQKIDKSVTILSDVEVSVLGNALLEVHNAKTYVEGELRTTQALQDLKQYEEVDIAKCELDDKYVSLYSSINEYLFALKNKSNSTNVYNDEHRSFNNKMKELGICPLCESEIK